MNSTPPRSILDIEGFQSPFFSVLFGSVEYIASFSDGEDAFFDSAPLPLNPPVTAVNGLPDLGNFHTYRLESPANSAAFAFFVDGVQQFAGTGVAAAASFNGFEWGDGASAPGNGADVDWDFVYFREVPAIPIPGSLVMMCLGLLGFLSLYRRRAQRA